MWLIFDQKCGLKWLIFVPPNCKQYWLFLTYFFNLKKFSEKFFACGSYFHRYTVKSNHYLAVVFIKYTVDWRKNNFPATVACTKLKKPSIFTLTKEAPYSSLKQVAQKQQAIKKRWERSEKRDALLCPTEWVNFHCCAGIYCGHNKTLRSLPSM